MGRQRNNPVTALDPWSPVTSQEVLLVAKMGEGYLAGISERRKAYLNALDGYPVTGDTEAESLFAESKKDLLNGLRELKTEEEKYLLIYEAIHKMPESERVLLQEEVTGMEVNGKGTSKSNLYKRRNRALSEVVSVCNEMTCKKESNTGS